jgi:hypothetical protein
VQRPFFAVGLVGVLEVCARDAMSEWSILDETLEGTPRGTPQARKVVLSDTAFASRLLCSKGT